MDDEENLRTMKEIRRELATIRELIGKVIFYVVDAQEEVHEKMRRFVTYMHDIHDVTYMYEQRGIPTPPWIMREMERCDDRFRQLLDEAHAEGNVFAKVRADMAKDPLNRWDHTRQLEKPKGDGNEAR